MKKVNKKIDLRKSKKKQKNKKKRNREKWTIRKRNWQKGIVGKEMSKKKNAKKGN